MPEKRRALRTPRDLADAGLIADARLPALEAVAARYAVAVTPAAAGLIDAQASADPIARQFVPNEAELRPSAGEQGDPIGDDRHSPVEGVVHRYKDRVLLKLTHVCAVYCRFCFRREMVGPGEEQVLSANALNAALAYIAEHEEIWEVILTGGDPLVLSPRRLREIVEQLSAIDHVKVLRWHTRVPIVEPERVSPELVRALASARQATYVAVHVNHARELTMEARAACALLVKSGIPLLGQSVLLKGVNDDVETLEALMRALIEARIKPYYLHHCDLAPGTSHFRTTVAKGQRLMLALQGRASGLCQPRYVLDIPGGHAKAQLTHADIEGVPGAYRLRDHNDCWHLYCAE